MNNVKRNLLIVLIAGAMSTYSYGMGHAVLIGADDAKRTETAASEKLIAETPSTSTAPIQPIPEGSRSPLDTVLPSEVPHEPKSPCVKSELEKTVYHGSQAAKETPGRMSPERSDSSSSSSSSPEREYVSASEGGSGIRRNISDSELCKARAADTPDQLVQARSQVAQAPVLARPVSPREASAEVPAAAGTKKADSSSALSRDPSSDALPVEEAMLRRPNDTKGATASAPTDADSAVAVGFSPKPAARAAVTFAQPDPASSAAGLANEVEKMGGSLNADKLAAAAQARKDAVPFDSDGGTRERAGSVSASSSSDSENAIRLPAPDKDVAAKPAALQKDSLLEKVKRNKLKTFALILALAEVADWVQAYLRTPKEELKDKARIDKVKIVGQKTIQFEAILGATNITKKSWSLSKEIFSDLKQKAQDYINKKQQTA